MNTNRIKNPKTRVALVVALICAAAVAVAIFVLTEQAPDVTSSESGFVNELLASLLRWIPGIHEQGSEYWFGIHIRHWAHVVEFFALGLFVAIAAQLAAAGSLDQVALRSAGKKASFRAAGVAVAVCAACSLFDQCHKLFVPGRHFDWFDLVMDASGYVLAIAVVLAVTLVRRARQASDARRAG